MYKFLYGCKYSAPLGKNQGTLSLDFTVRTFLVLQETARLFSRGARDFLSSTASPLFPFPRDTFFSLDSFLGLLSLVVLNKEIPAGFYLLQLESKRWRNPCLCCFLYEMKPLCYCVTAHLCSIWSQHLFYPFHVLCFVLLGFQEFESFYDLELSTNKTKIFWWDCDFFSVPDNSFTPAPLSWSMISFLPSHSSVYTGGPKGCFNLQDQSYLDPRQYVMLNECYEY